MTNEKVWVEFLLGLRMFGRGTGWQWMICLEEKAGLSIVPCMSFIKMNQRGLGKVSLQRRMRKLTGSFRRLLLCAENNNLCFSRGGR